MSRPADQGSAPARSPSLTPPGRIEEASLAPAGSAVEPGRCPARPGPGIVELLAKLQRAAQTSTTDGILFHQAVADRVGLHVTDLRCLNLLANAGQLTAGELGQQLGLGTTGAVTRMVDRLERAGYVRRQVDPRDRRRVIIQPVPEQLATIAPHYQGMAATWTDLLATYRDEQLALFVDLFDRMHQMSQQQLASLDQPTPSSKTATS